MFEWSDEHLMVRDAVRQFVEQEIRPQREELEFGDTPPYDVLRKLYRTFGLDALARESFKKRIEAERAQQEAGEASGASPSLAEERAPAGRGTPPPASDDR